MSYFEYGLGIKQEHLFLFPMMFIYKNRDGVVFDPL